jgi:hypothetical protein
VIEGRDQVDWKRHGVFVTFGFFYLVSFIPASLEQLGMIMSARQLHGSLAQTVRLLRVAATAAAVTAHRVRRPCTFQHWKLRANV